MFFPINASTWLIKIRVRFGLSVAAMSAIFYFSVFVQGLLVSCHRNNDNKAQPQGGGAQMLLRFCIPINSITFSFSKAVLILNFDVSLFMLCFLCASRPRQKSMNCEKLKYSIRNSPPPPSFVFLSCSYPVFVRQLHRKRLWECK